MAVSGRPASRGRGSGVDSLLHGRRSGKSRGIGRVLAVAGMAQGFAVVLPATAAALTVEDLGRLSIEDLADIQVTSVSRHAEPLSRAPASIYVISREDIRRSGATSLPEALRLAPNLQVARLDARSYAISARGFNSVEAANKLLVLIDGRSVYTPFHGGVFWDEPQVMLGDIERIEVISGPGGTLWGSNAVNGVINVITRTASQTRGPAADLRLGNRERSASARYGGRIGGNASYRVYAMGADHGDSLVPSGASPLEDGWDSLQAGFRTDWQGAADTVTLQGDLYNNDTDIGGVVTGRNLLARWRRELGERSSWEVQAYYDKVERSPQRAATDESETFDIEAQHVVPLGTRHEIVWGGGYRFVHDEFRSEPSLFTILPPSRDVRLGNLFVQDGISLRDDVTLTLGMKVEYSSLTGAELLPSMRLAWQVTDTALLWSAVSRAARTPSRIDLDLVSPGLLEGGPNFVSEKLMAYEIGYRGQPLPGTSLSVTFFYNDYDDLRSVETSPGGGLPLTFGNRLEGESYGIEAWGDYRVNGWWRLAAGFNLLQEDFRLAPGSLASSLGSTTGNNPNWQASLRSSMDLARGIELDVGLRAVDDLPNPAVSGYFTVDARLGWQVADDVELSLTGLNLLDERHAEMGNPAQRREFGRSVYLGLSWGL
jgi:iron complex outermembrane recepter protein